MLHNTGASGDRIIDISVQCEHSGYNASEGAVAANDADTPASPRLPTETSESLHTLVIPTVPALDVESLATYRRPTQRTASPATGLMDLTPYDLSTCDRHAEAVIRTTIVSPGPWDIVVEAFAFLPVSNLVVSCSHVADYAVRQRKGNK